MADKGQSPPPAALEVAYRKSREGLRDCTAAAGRLLKAHGSGCLQTDSNKILISASLSVRADRRSFGWEG